MQVKNLRRIAVAPEDGHLLKVRRTLSVENVIYVVLAVVVVAIIKVNFFKKHVVREYEIGLLYSNGRFARALGPGAYWMLRRRSEVTNLDKRRQSMAVASQELVSADQVGIKLSLVVTYEVADPLKAMHLVSDYRAELYSAAQLAIRRVASELKIEELLTVRTQLGEKLLPQVKSAAEQIGLTVHSVDCRDIMFPGDLKKTFSDVLRAQKEGQAALERARGETAALRSLANAARMINDNPGLLHLRTLQAVSAGSGNTIVLGTSPGIIPVSRQSGSTQSSAPDNGGDDAQDLT
jgi:regulator of protease activity HflC (stomatin/prohibitin superfamily)